MSSLILTTAQAEAVYSAMCALNNVGSGLHAKGIAFSSTVPEVEVMERRNGTIAIGRNLDDAKRGAVLESYADQSAFAAAYNLE